VYNTKSGVWIKALVKGGETRWIKRGKVTLNRVGGKWKGSKESEALCP